MSDDKREQPATAGLCVCEWTPGIDLPTAECDEHWGDLELCHWPTATRVGVSPVERPQK